MGYTTRFDGSFKLSKPLTHDQWLTLASFSKGRQTCGPGGYCQWTPNRQGTELEWDRGEKFYDYAEWLKYLIDTFLTPWGIELSGEVTWQGEEVGDVGVLSANGKEVSKRKLDRAGEEVPFSEIRGHEVNERFLRLYLVTRR